MLSDEDSGVIYSTGSREAEGGEPTATRVLRLSRLFSVFKPLMFTILCKCIKKTLMREICVRNPEETFQAMAISWETKN